MTDYRKLFEDNANQFDAIMVDVLAKAVPETSPTQAMDYRSKFSENAELFDAIRDSLLAEHALLTKQVEYATKRISEFDTVVRRVCGELEVCYGGVDVDSGEIVAEIQRLKELKFYG